MTFLIKSLIILWVVISALPGYALQGEGKSDEALIERVGAVQALAIANQWKWSTKEIKSYVNSREVVFQFPGGKVINIPLPKEKMVVALAPYIKETHT
ncbi:MAG: hypothetical protein U1C55_10785 [Smithellaceae bacterium]|nr:hypothetical protein [Smithellaceae bacterium]